jgi:hypothetical protein
VDVVRKLLDLVTSGPRPAPFDGQPIDRSPGP